MAFVNISLLLGGLFAAIPIVLHLTMRRQPQRQLFPALQLVRERRESNRRKLQLRHWLLLVLRCGLIGLMAAALARPSVAALQTAPWMLTGLLGCSLLLAASALVWAAVQHRPRWQVAGLAVLSALLGVLFLGTASAALRRETPLALGNQRAPVAAVVVVDTSPRMEYRYENRTRLEVARDSAMWLLKQLPAGSEIAVVDTRPGPAVFSVDLAAARKAVDRLRTTPLAEPVAATVERGVRLLRQSKRSRKEMYLFTDATRSAWPEETAARLDPLLDAVPELALYVVDLGIDEPMNFALGDLRLSADSVTGGNELVVTTELKSRGLRDRRVVDLFVEERSFERPLVVDGQTLLPEAIRRDEVAAELTEGGMQPVEFRVRGLSPGVHQGFVRIRGSDSLPVDDVRYFAVEVREPWPVLVAAPANVAVDLFVEAIAPYEFRETGQSSFVCTVVDQTEIPDSDLSAFAAVCLLDPRPLASSTWGRLSRYVAAGGGVAVFLGRNARSASAFDDPQGRDLIGAKLARQWRAGGRDLFLAPTRFDHPILAAFEQQATSIPWSDSPVFRHWQLDDLRDQTQVLIAYSNNEPALLESRHAQGRVLTLTTPITDPLTASGPPTWNELPTSENAWPYLVLINELMRYLVDDATSRLNFLAGEAVGLTNDPGRHPDRYRLFPPGEPPVEVTAQQGRLTIGFTEQPGAYRLKGQRGDPIVRGFAVNTPARLTELDRLERKDLARFLGEDRFHYARRREEILIEVGESRVGREFYPYLVTLLVVVLGLEHLLSNRFYRKAP